MENYKDYISIDSKIMLGKPVIKGTRITVELILEKFAAGQTIEDIIKSHSSLNKTFIQTALNFAVENLRSHYVFPIGFHYSGE